MKSDLKAISTDNNLFKYVDDTTLLVPEHSAVDIVTEFYHIRAWATANKLCINTTKNQRDCLAPARTKRYNTCTLDPIDPTPLKRL